MVISVLVTISLIIGAKYFYEICYKNYYLTVTGIVEYADGIGRQIIDFENLVGDDVEMNTTATIRKQEYIPERFQKILNIRNKKKGYVVLYEYSFPFSFTSDSAAAINVSFSGGTNISLIEIEIPALVA